MTAEIFTKVSSTTKLSKKCLFKKLPSWIILILTLLTKEIRIKNNIEFILRLRKPYDPT